jgi:DNA repair protein RecN (Recombination protein N)
LIERLSIRELALVEELELELGPGLNVFTGETGAGKSIVLGALALLAGRRAPADLVREGAAEARVEAVLGTKGLPELEAALTERGLERDEGELIVRRTVARSGRGRSWLGAGSVPVAALVELIGEAIEVSSQHASLALLRPEAQGRLLDAFADAAGLRSEVENGVRGLRSSGEEIARLEAEAEERARRSDYLQFQLGELDEARLDPEEARAIGEEQRRLANAERLGTETAAAATLLLGDPGAPEARGAADAVGAAASAVEALTALDPELEPLADRLGAARSELGDVAAELERYAGRSELDPGRLEEVDRRLAELERIRRKYGGSIEAALALREEVAAELAALGGSDDRLRKLTSEREAEHARVAERATELSRVRKRAARKLAQAADAALHELALEQARFEVALDPVSPPAGLPCGAAGHESAELQFAANPGEPFRALRQVASGGELSRVFLALKDVLRTTGSGRVLVFDEVDAGIGGAVAERVGARLAALAKRHQVLCITHLPQIAAHADRHFLVEKRSTRGRTRTHVRPLDEAGRVEEIGRMAGGKRVTAATLDHARALLAAAHREGKTGGKSKSGKKPASPRKAPRKTGRR